jgi:PTS system nitrogen regulatory IIA component
MDITNLISESLICTNLKGETKDEIISELVDIVDKSNCLYNKYEFLNDVLKREKSISTGIGNGIGMPHGKSTAVKQACLALGISKKGINFDSMDDELVNIIFLIAVPKEADDLHLKVLGCLSRKLMHEEFREALKKENTSKKIIELLNS